MQSNSSTPSGLHTPSASISAPVTNTVAATGSTAGLDSQDQLLHNMLTSLARVSGLDRGMRNSDLTTGLISQGVDQPFQFCWTTLHGVDKAQAPTDLDLINVKSIKNFMAHFARVIVKDLKVTVVADPELIGAAAQISVGWIPSGKTKPAQTANMKGTPGMKTFIIGGMAFAGHQFEVPCAFDLGIQPILKAPLPFSNTPKLVAGCHGVYAADGSGKKKADVCDLIVSGTLVYEGVFAQDWSEIV